MKEAIRKLRTNVIICYVDTDSRGNKTLYNPSGMIVGKYDKSQNKTYDKYGYPVYSGDALVLLIVNN